LRSDPRLQPFFGAALKAEGLNIEGLAVIGGDLFAGLRAPLIDGKAVLVKVGIDALFAPGRAPLKAAPDVIPVALGDGAGIRDLAALPDGRLLALAGPTQNQTDVPFSLFKVALPDGAATQIATLAEERFEDRDGATRRAKAEGMVVLDADPLRILVFFDGPENGAPREYIVGE
jgi:hypothetical protein